jgi:adenylate kinase family enzyme
MTDRPALRPVCLIGPPAAGKTTLAEALSQALGGTVLRPRDITNRALGVYPATASLFPRDRRGYVPDDSLGFALRVCLDRIRRTAIFESLPWDAIQLADMYRVAGDRLLVLQLAASDEQVMERRVGRMYCASCYPQSTTNTGGIRCSRCGTALMARPDDEHAAFVERLRVFRTKVVGVLDLARRLEIHVFNLDARRSPSELVSLARAATGRANDCFAA